MREGLANGSFWLLAQALEGKVVKKSKPQLVFQMCMFQKLKTAGTTILFWLLGGDHFPRKGWPLQ